MRNYYENEECLAFYLQDDNTYSVKIGEATNLTSITIPSTYKGKEVKISANFNSDANGLTMESNFKNIIVSDGVTCISSKAFYNCTNLVSITLPTSINSIEDEAFSGCSALETISIPSTVTKIGSSVFSRYTSLTTVKIPNSVTFLGSYAFSDCTKLVFVALPEKITNLSSTFSTCTKLKNIYYTGCKDDLDDNIDIKQVLKKYTIYYYSETAPTDTTYKYWHYVDGEVVAW